MALLADINRQDGAPELRRRVRFLYLVLFLVFGGLLVRLFFLQVIDGERYTFLSENNRIRIKRIPGTRGMVVDRQGQLLVDSRPSFDLLFVAEDAAEPESTLRQLARYLRRDEKELLAVLEENKKRPAFEEIVIGKDVDWATVVARICTVVYFLFFLLMPIYTSIEKTKPVPERVTMK